MDFTILNDTRKPDGFAPPRGAFYEAISDFPRCNHTVSVSERNLGYTQGVMADGAPFEAELWTDHNSLNLSLVIPDLGVISPQTAEPPGEPLPGGNIIGFHCTVDRDDGSVLCIGMVERGRETSLNSIRQYVNYLEAVGIIAFTTPVRNGSVLYVTDENGVDLARVTIALQMYGEVQASTPLCFRRFPGSRQISAGNIVTGWSKPSDPK